MMANTSIALPPRSRKRRILRILCVLVGVGALLFSAQAGAFIYFGATDSYGQADMLVVPGNKVNPDGKPGDILRARLLRAHDLFAAGHAPLIFVSGGFGREGFDEALVMHDWLMARGVPEKAIVIDSDGTNTFHTARNAARALHQRGLTRALAVTHYYHVPRLVMALERFGVATVQQAHANDAPTLREPYALARECAAYWYYRFRAYDAHRGATSRGRVTAGLFSHPFADMKER